ncbi:hypothetical protein GRI62_00390 [Erythrobacter arachoides]|uniref:Uncharacterized protein n=1 Tax=Aurantiacibacter arachoides TaxID=1850444 RepID=A0A844ZVJ3_9SPHN|nr:hypothetical protein [Aurantiacibacter arachoides]MXO92063.1 hypothetical protein [Aurantiacibacter arachoides]GGD60058.1 hypothetical protein GCM10011411_20270 [Aurantiacibacter arachoides]
MTQKANSLRRSLKMLFNGIGVNPGRVRALKNYRKYRAQCEEFLRQGGTITGNSMILYDFADNAGTASGDYFHQDLLVAKLVFEAQPRRHIDVASRVDGFVAQLACFREVEVVDVRPLPPSVHTNIKFVQVDLTRPQ